MDNIALICILYRPSGDCLQYWANISLLIPNCIFVDNTPDCVSRADDLGNGIYIQLRENKGIATAQNYGIAKAHDLDVEFVVFFDQDSRFDVSLVTMLKEEFIALRSNGIKIGAIGPLIFDVSRGELYKGNKFEGEVPHKTTTLISSGTFTSLSVLDEIGGMLDELFIDGVDTEWCWRLKSRGYQSYKSAKAILPHKVGRKAIKLFGQPFLISEPFRYYYQYRNFILLCKLDYVPSSRKIKSTIRKAIELFIVPWYTQQPLHTMKYMFKGLRAGLQE